MSSNNHILAHEILEIIPIVMRPITAKLRQAGSTMNLAHFHLLVLLTRNSHNLSELAEKQAVSLPTMSNTVSTLVDRGWVTRIRSTRDRRKVQIEITPEGLDILEQIWNEAEVYMTEFIASLNPDECEKVLEGLVILRKVFSAPLK